MDAALSKNEEGSKRTGKCIFMLSLTFKFMHDAHFQKILLNMLSILGLYVCFRVQLVVKCFQISNGVPVENSACCQHPGKECPNDSTCKVVLASQKQSWNVCLGP